MSRYTYDELNTWPVPPAPYDPTEDLAAIEALVGAVFAGDGEYDELAMHASNALTSLEWGIRP